MFINGVQCDACCKIHNKNVHQNPFPDKWVSLQQDQQELHFCSIHCLHAWVEKQTIVLNESVDPSRLELWKEVKVFRAEVIDNPSQKCGEFEVTQEDCDRWRDL